MFLGWRESRETLQAGAETDGARFEGTIESAMVVVGRAESAGGHDIEDEADNGRRGGFFLTLESLSVLRSR